MEEIENMYNQLVRDVLEMRMSEQDFTSLYFYLNEITECPGTTTAQKFYNWLNWQPVEVLKDYLRLAEKAGSLLGQFNTQTLGFSNN